MAIPEETNIEDKNCSRCQAVLDTTGYPLWCKKCRAANKREYEATRKEMSESRGFRSGVAAAKGFLASEFRRAIGPALISGTEAAQLVEICRGPSLPQ
jgi:hypothetical protein